MKNLLILLPSLLLSSPVALPAAESNSARPNLVIIQTDEHNFRTLGCYRALVPREQAFIWGGQLQLSSSGESSHKPPLNSRPRRPVAGARFGFVPERTTPGRGPMTDFTLT